MLFILADIVVTYKQHLQMKWIFSVNDFICQFWCYGDNDGHCWGCS